MDEMGASLYMGGYGVVCEVRTSIGGQMRSLPLPFFYHSTLEAFENSSDQDYPLKK